MPVLKSNRARENAVPYHKNRQTDGRLAHIVLYLGTYLQRIIIGGLVLCRRQVGIDSGVGADSMTVYRQVTRRRLRRDRNITPYCEPHSYDRTTPTYTIQRP